MHRISPERVDGILGRIFWLPVACLIAVELYARNFDGWGAWATAPLFLLPFVLSLAIAGAGAYQIFSEFRSGNARLSTIVLTTVSVCPVVWLMVRRYFV